MVAFFRFSLINILSVHLPPSMLEFGGDVQQEWIRREAAELMVKTEMLYAEISDVLDSIELKSKSSNGSELSNHIMELRDQIRKERNDYNRRVSFMAMNGGGSQVAVSSIATTSCYGDIIPWSSSCGHPRIESHKAFTHKFACMGSAT